MTPSPSPLTDDARAKLNLFLHVGARRTDGYHDLCSLAVFPNIYDRLSATCADNLTLEIDGPFAGGLSTGSDNLVVKAATDLQILALRKGHAVKGAALRLTKNLPLASGIGGGSADAAAALRILRRLWQPALRDKKLSELALELGSDVPVCLLSRSTIMEGRGERLTDAPALPPMVLLLVNLGVAIPTADVFRQLESRTGHDRPIIPANFPSTTDFAHWLRLQRNDLEAPAINIAPVIADVLANIAAQPGCQLARMSGSGATCFGLFENQSLATHAHDALVRTQKNWWVKTGAV